MTPDEQLQAWERGESIHRDDGGDGECCPDFSCCEPQLKAAPAVRQRFATAYRQGDLETVEELLGVFLDRMARMALEGEGIEQPPHVTM